MSKKRSVIGSGLLALLISLMALKICADEIVKTKDGRNVLLKDNFTWEYSKPSKPVARESLNPSTANEALEQWKSFRASASSHNGEKVIWKVVIRYGGVNADGGMDAYIDGGDIYHEIMLYQDKKLHKDDIVIVRGKFIGVSENGSIKLRSLSEKVVGVKGQ